MMRYGGFLIELLYSASCSSGFTTWYYSVRRTSCAIRVVLYCLPCPGWQPEKYHKIVS